MKKYEGRRIRLGLLGEMARGYCIVRRSYETY